MAFITLQFGSSGTTNATNFQYIEQSGIDIGLSALAGNPQVTATVTNGFTTYELNDNVRLVITGFLRILPEREVLIVNESYGFTANVTLAGADLTGGSMISVGSLGSVNTGQTHVPASYGTAGTLEVGDLSGDFIASSGTGIVIQGNSDPRAFAFQGIIVQPSGKMRLIQSNIMTRLSIRNSGSIDNLGTAPDFIELNEAEDAIVTTSASAFVPHTRTGHTGTFDLASVGNQSGAFETVGICTITYTKINTRFEVYGRGFFTDVEGELVNNGLTAPLGTGRNADDMVYQFIQAPLRLANLISQQTLGYQSNQAVLGGRGVLNYDFTGPVFNSTQSDIVFRSASNTGDFHWFRFFSPPSTGQTRIQAVGVGANPTATQQFNWYKGTFRRFININRVVQTLDGNAIIGHKYLATQIGVAGVINEPIRTSGNAHAFPIVSTTIWDNTDADDIDAQVTLDVALPDGNYAKKIEGTTDANGLVSITPSRTTWNTDEAGPDGINIPIEWMQYGAPSESNNIQINGGSLGGELYETVNLPATTEYRRLYGWLPFENTIATGTKTDDTAPIFITHDANLATRVGGVLTFITGLDKTSIDDLVFTQGATNENSVIEIYASVAAISDRFSSIAYPVASGTNSVLDIDILHLGAVDSTLTTGQDRAIIEWDGATEALSVYSAMNANGPLSGYVLSRTDAMISWIHAEPISNDLTADFITAPTISTAGTGILIDGSDVSGELQLLTGTYTVQNTDVSNLSVTRLGTTGTVTILLGEGVTGTITTGANVVSEEIIVYTTEPALIAGTNGFYELRNITTSTTIVNTTITNGVTDSNAITEISATDTDNYLELYKLESSILGGQVYRVQANSFIGTSLTRNRQIVALTVPAPFTASATAVKPGGDGNQPVTMSYLQSGNAIIGTWLNNTTQSTRPNAFETMTAVIDASNSVNYFNWMVSRGFTTDPTDYSSDGATVFNNSVTGLQGLSITDGIVWNSEIATAQSQVSQTAGLFSSNVTGVTVPQVASFDIGNAPLGTVQAALSPLVAALPTSNDLDTAIDGVLSNQVQLGAAFGDPTSAGKGVNPIILNNLPG